MILVTFSKSIDYPVNWSEIKHPVIVKHSNGNLYLTIPISYVEEKTYDDNHRDCICLYSVNNEIVGTKTYKLNLEFCQLYNEEIKIQNKK